MEGRRFRNKNELPTDGNIKGTCQAHSPPLPPPPPPSPLPNEVQQPAALQAREEYFLKRFEANLALSGTCLPHLLPPQVKNGNVQEQRRWRERLSIFLMFLRGHINLSGYIGQFTPSLPTPCQTS